MIDNHRDSLDGGPSAHAQIYNAYKMKSLQKKGANNKKLL